ncbi:hypothetical protein [Homoserinimonas sp. OAct 916]|uniref:hypothetical protein n=1 Tax=Homoserinimonas sp. OAct 916 TaxID=2211450 RepID=UPI000DBEA6F7|nr:hypothetical protein [Homoserinimonas sp. OAct 916]
MTENRKSGANTGSAGRLSLPFLGVTALISGAITPAWVVLTVITGGPEAAAWVPVIVLFLMPFNLVVFALFIGAVVCGIYALRNAGTDRVLGRIGLILAGVQLLAAVAYLVWALTDGLFGG